MKLKSKTVFFSIVAVVVFFCIALYIQHKYILPTYSKIEQNEAFSKVVLTSGLLTDTINKVKNSSLEIAESDIVIQLMNNQLNLADTVIISNYFKISGFDLAFIYDQKDKLVYDYQLNARVNIFQFKLLNNELFKDISDRKMNAGLFKSSLGNMIVAVSPIVNDSSNVKIGTVVTAKFINTSYLNKLFDEAGFTAELRAIDNYYDTPIGNSFTSFTNGTQIVFFENDARDKNYLNCNLKLSGIGDSSKFLLKCKIERSAYEQAKNLNTFIMYILTIIGIIIILVTTNSIQFAVIKPIRKLTMKIFDIRKAADITLRTDMVKRKDEIGILSNEFDSLLSQLETSIEEKGKIIKDKMQEMKETRNDAIFRLTMAIDSRDVGSSKHIEETHKMMALFASKLDIPKDKCEMYGIASTLHDIGKIGVPEYILEKTGKYTPEEFNSMKTHTLIGGNIFSDGDTELIETAHEMAMYHHEWWNGEGYIEGLKKTNIPLPARMMTIIDVFNGMLSKRNYRKAFTTVEVIEYMKDNEGKIFDPDLLHIFLGDIDEFIDIVNSHSISDKTIKL